MPNTIVIIGFKIPFKQLWKRTGTREQPACSCKTTEPNFTFCPHCGTRKRKSIVKMYSNLLTGEETSYRNLEACKEFLQMHNLAVYDANPRGFTDEPVYLYFTDPNCYIESVGTSRFATSPKANKCLDKLEEWLYDFLGEQLWAAGEFGVWLLEKEAEAVVTVTTTQPAKPPETPQPQTRAFIIPFGPMNNE